MGCCLKKYPAVKNPAAVKKKNCYCIFLFSAQLVRNWENFSRQKLFKITFYMGPSGRIIRFQNTWVSKNFLKFQQHRKFNPGTAVAVTFYWPIGAELRKFHSAKVVQNHVLHGLARTEYENFKSMINYGFYKNSAFLSFFFVSFFLSLRFGFRGVTETIVSVVLVGQIFSITEQLLSIWDQCCSYNKTILLYQSGTHFININFSEFWYEYYK